MGFGFPILALSIWLIGWIIWTRILKRKKPNLLIQFLSAFAGAFLVWHLLVLYPVYDLRHSLSYAEVIRIVEEKSDVRFDPHGSVVGLTEGASLEDGLSSCGIYCLNNYCNNKIKQKYIYYIGSYYKENIDNNIKYIPEKKYLQYYYGECPNAQIRSENYENQLDNLIDGVDSINIGYNNLYLIMGVKFKVLFFNYNHNFRYAYVYMDKQGSWLQGMPDDASGDRDREPIIKFDWLDVLRSQGNGDKNG